MSHELVSYSPLDGKPVGSLKTTSTGELPEIFSRSRVAQKKWGSLTALDRAETLRPVGRRLLEEIERLSHLISKEMGKPVSAAAGEVKACAKAYGAEIDEMVESLASSEVRSETTSSEVFYDPFGISVAITPWNFPLLMPQWQILPSLVAGNSVVFKPSEETPLSGQAFAEILNEFLPTDVLIPVHGDGGLGKALVSSDQTDLITFTGSKQTGVHILDSAGKKLTRVILELGGKDPLIVLKSADLQKAAQFAAGNSFRNSGQVCVSTERIYVDQSVKEKFLAAFKDATAQLKVGDSLEEDTQVGPMVNSRQKELVVGQIDQALDQGAKSLTGSHVADGNFIRPTILVDVNHSMSVMSDETFGPVVGVMEFEQVEEAIHYANENSYALGAAIFGDPKEARQVARRIQSGMVGINRGVSGVAGTPWVGAKDSGFGFHGAKWGHRQFAQIRVVSEPCD